MLLGVHTGLHDAIAVQDLGIDNLTAVGGLAVGRASGFVGSAMERLLAGFYTLSDQEMYDLLGLLARAEQIKLEPSALAGMAGPWRVAASSGRPVRGWMPPRWPEPPTWCGPPAAAWCPPRRWKSTWPAPATDLFSHKTRQTGGFSRNGISKMAPLFAPVSQTARQLDTLNCRQSPSWLFCDTIVAVFDICTHVGALIRRDRDPIRRSQPSRACRKTVA